MTAFVTLVCWRCEEPGHGYRECKRPPAKTRQELGERIDRILFRWDAGNGISTYLKNEFIAAERKAFGPVKARAK